jgi:hypothetical protein
VQPPSTWQCSVAEPTRTAQMTKIATINSQFIGKQLHF